MNHCILIKWKDLQVARSLYSDIRSLFENALTIPGISDIEFIENCVDRSNRYDFLIRITMEKDSLASFDESDVHAVWKEMYGQYIEVKAIFDYI